MTKVKTRQFIIQDVKSNLHIDIRVIKNVCVGNYYVLPKWIPMNVYKKHITLCNTQ